MAGDITTGADDLTVSVLALIWRKPKWQVRSDLLASACAQARRDPDVAEIIRLVTESRRRHEKDSVVVPLARHRWAGRVR